MRSVPLPGQRTYGTDTDIHTWSPIVTRPKLTWPGGARVALAVIVNLEHYGWAVPQGAPQPVTPFGGPPGLWTDSSIDPGRWPDIGGYGNHEYGNRVGVFRIIDLLDKYGITPTLALDATTAENYPYLVAEGKKRNAEFIAHGLSRRELIHVGMSDAEELEYIQKSIAAVEKATGIRPAGWLGPDMQETVNTPHLLAAEGITYLCDWGNDEQPYKMTPRTGELYSLGVNLQLDDNYTHVHGRRTIHEMVQIWCEWFEGLYADGAVNGRMMVVNLHPWIMGQPWRIGYLDKALAHISAYQGVWKATGSQIIDWFKQQQQS
jgi:peptidoglycan/xylan/chitin deacetylase (PgdA/CDA1 family)